MRENRLRTLWANDQAAVNGWLAIANSFSAETMAHQGWDTLTIDLQHGVVDYQAMVSMLQAISTTATVPIVRVPWLEPGILMKTLDAGEIASLSELLLAPRRSFPVRRPLMRMASSISSRWAPSVCSALARSRCPSAVRNCTRKRSVRRRRNGFRPIRPSRTSSGRAST